MNRVSFGEEPWDRLGDGVTAHLCFLGAANSVSHTWKSLVASSSLGQI